MRAVAYCRFSSENQRDGYSIEAQLFAIKEFCAKEGLELIGQYVDEARTGTNAERERFQKMIADSDKGLFDVVVVHKLDRFSRDRYDSAVYKKVLKDHRIRLMSVTEHLDNSPESVMMESVLEGYAEFYSKNLSRETKKGLYARARRGLACSNRPFGYDVSPEGRFMVNEKNAVTVREIYDRVITGESLASIARSLNERGLRGVRGAAFQYPSLRKIIQSGFYKGTFTFGAGRETPVVIENCLDPIVAPDTWLAANEALGKHRNTAYKRFKREDYILTGLIYCGSCGSHFTGHSTKSKAGKVYSWYRCTGAALHECHQKPSNLNKDVIEDFVIQSICQDVLQPRNIVEWTKRLNERIRERALNGDASLAKKELATLQNKKARLLDVYLDGNLEKAEYLKKALDLDRQISLAKAKIKQAEAPAHELSEESLRAAMDFYYQSFSFKSKDYKARIINSIVERVTVSPDSIEILYKIKGPEGEPITSISPNANHGCGEFVLRIKYRIPSFREGALGFDTLRMINYTVSIS